MVFSILWKQDILWCLVILFYFCRNGKEIVEWKVGCRVVFVVMSLVVMGDVFMIVIGLLDIEDEDLVIVVDWNYVVWC